GGIVGYAYSTGSLEVLECGNEGSVTGTGSNVGGIVGYAYSTGSLEVLECGNEGSVTGTGSYTGGITGYARLASSGELSMGSLYNAGTVSGTSYVGGITGRNCASLYDAYNTGTVTGTAVTTGGITGNNYAAGTVLSNAYNAGEVTYTSSGVAYAGGLLAGSISGTGYILYVDNAYYLSTLDGSAAASGSSYLYSYSTQAALTDDELAAMAKTSDELAALADTLGDSFVENTDSDYHLGYPVLAWEETGDDAEELRIITQPEDYTGTAGSTAVFEVEASGSGLAYQWQYLNAGASIWRDSGMDGADTASISVPVTEARDGQQYRCIVTDADGNTVTSDAATLTVSGAAGLAITLQPSDYTGEEGSTATFTVEADGTGLTYQWQYKSPGGTMWHDSGMTGAATATLSVPITAARDGQQYRCIVTDENGNSATSDAATLTVSDGSSLRITLQPSDYTGEEGSTATFTVEADGTGLTYQWQYKSPGGTMWHDSGMEGADTAALSVPITAARDGQQYRCVVTDADGNTVTSDAAALYVSGTD
ncbi:MAG: immunoglobulin domain-containing protein, partial [Clostridiales bacterium]|nr:immunoglobulin domain-containing protein [Clostridiales bacterium]